MTLRLGFILCPWPMIQLAPPPGPESLQDQAPFTGGDSGGSPCSPCGRVILFLTLTGHLDLQARQLRVLQLYALGLSGVFFSFLFPQTRNQYLGSKGDGEAGGRAPGDRSLQPPKAALFSRRNPPDSFSTKWLQRKPCRANDKGEMESLPYQLLYSGRNSPHFLACAVLATAPSGLAACFPF